MDIIPVRSQLSEYFMKGTAKYGTVKDLTASAD